MTQKAKLDWISVEDYLEGRSPVRHEYIGGRVFATVGGTLAHNRIAVNITSVLHRHLRGTPCAVYMSDVKVRVSAVDAFYYPDVVVSCEPYRPESLYLEEPILIVEVLSPSTEAVDRREKLLNYQKLPLLREYLLVASEEIRIEVYRRGGDRFGEVELYGPEDRAVPLASVELELPLGEVYAGVFDGSPDAP